MMPGRIKGVTRVLGAPDGMEGNVTPLSVRDEVIDGEVYMISAHYPSTEEIAALVTGAPIMLYVNGDLHPIVGLAVGAVDDAVKYN